MVTEDHIYKWLEEIPDPEIPVISIVGLGMIRDVRISNGAVEVDLSPTYTACPAMQMIEEDIGKLLSEKGCRKVRIQRVIHPP